MQNEGAQVRQSMVRLAWGTWATVAAEIRGCDDWWLRTLAWMSLTVGLGGLCGVGALVALSAAGAPPEMVVLGTAAGFGAVTLAWAAAWTTSRLDAAQAVDR